MKMDLLIIVSNPDASPIITPLVEACGRAGIKWATFFTNDGVTTLDNDNLVKALQSADDAAVCQESWDLHMNGKKCPIALGSQTTNSALVSQSDKVLSL
jgi:hypothetical protein